MTNNPLLDRVYYSQNREDLILEAFFPDIKNGFYVDVGASDPVKYSVTKLFYDQGWSGINIEPIRHHFDALVAQRPRDINMNTGVGSKKQTLTFHEYTGGDGLSTFSSEVADEYSRQEDFPFKNGKEYKVAVRTLKDIFTAQKVKHIHFIKVDVEGFEYDVLAGNDWDVYRPEVICIEANHITKNWKQLLQKARYSLAFFDGLNEYYADATTDRQSKFDFVNSVVIGRDGGLGFSDYSSIIEYDQAAQEANVRLQEALKSSTIQNEAYQKLLAENHRNNVRAVVAERALRKPSSFVKYQLKRLHHRVLHALTAKPAAIYSKQEVREREKALEGIDQAKNDTQLLVTARKIASVETRRLYRIATAANTQSILFRLYTKSVNSVKRLRLRGYVK